MGGGEAGIWDPEGVVVGGEQKEVVTGKGVW